MTLRQDSVESTGDWGYFADEQPGPHELSSSSSSGDESSVDGESRSSSLDTTLSAASTAGLAELNTWLWDSCELGVAAWMRSGVAANRDGRRRCYFMTGGDGDWRCYGHYQPTGGGPGHTHHQHRAIAAACACAGTYRPRRQVVTTGRRRNKACGPHCRGSNTRGTTPQQLWCVTPLEPGRVQASRWEAIETVMTPRLCPRVFSREFSGGIIVGASFGSIRVVSNSLTGARYSEYLLMVSVGERCRRAWRRQSHFKRHAQRHWGRWSPVCRAAWTLAETERRWWPCVDDFPYVASRQAALEAVLREILFSTDSPTELIELAGSDSDDLGPPPSLAEVKTRHADNTEVAAYQLAASDEDYAALFGGRLAIPRAVGFSALSDVVVASLTQSCRRNDLCVASCSPLNRRRTSSLSGSKKRRSRSPLARRTANRRSTSEPAYPRQHTFSEIGDELPPNADLKHSDSDDSPALVVASSVFRRRKPNNEQHIQMSPTEAALMHPALDTAQARQPICLSPISLIRACFPVLPALDNHAHTQGKSLANSGYRRANRRLRDRAGTFENGLPADSSHRPRIRAKRNDRYCQSAASQTDTDNPLLLPPLIAALRRGASSNRMSQQKHFVRPIEPHPLFSSPLKEHAVYDINDSRPRVVVA